jgi:hypothetical protein
VVVLAGLNDEARLALADDTLSRTRRLLGEDDYRTLASAEALVRVLCLSGRTSGLVLVNYRPAIPDQCQGCVAAAVAGAVARTAAAAVVARTAATA